MNRDFSDFDFLRPATAEEYSVVRSLEHGVYSCLTDLHGEFGAPKVMTCWASEHGVPLCRVERTEIPSGEYLTGGKKMYWINPDYAPRGV